jgi:outer membrane protein assembly factor BamB
MKPALKATIVLAGSLCACGGASRADPVLASDWQNDRGESIARVQSRLAAAPLPAGTALAVGVTSVGLVGAPLDGGATWQQRIDVTSRPVISGDVVVVTDRTNLILLEARSGRRLWSVPHQGRRLIGAGDDGTLTLLSMAPHGGKSLLLAIARSGTVQTRLELRPMLGDPVVRGGIGLVPWGNQYVSAIDLGSGEEIGRLLTRDQVSRAMNLGGQLYVGERVLLRFDERIDQAWRGAATKAALPARELPGAPRWWSGAAVEATSSGAPDRIQILALPGPDGTRVAGSFAATYFRLVMGFDAGDAALRWVRRFEHDVIGGAAGQRGFALCDAAGKVSLLDDAGNVSGSLALGAPLSACVVQAAPWTAGTGKAERSLTDQIAAVIRATDADLAPAQRILLADLARLADPRATEVLIQLASDARTVPVILRDARALLATRKTGAEYMLKALERHYDFLDDVLLTPPLGPLADALLAMNETRAAPLLAEHVNDPANPAGEVRRAARALEALATSEELDQLKQFFALYRASAEQQEMIDAVLSVGRTLLRVGGEEGRRIVVSAASDPLTHPQVQKGLSTAISRKG